MQINEQMPNSLTMFFVKLFGKRKQHTEEEWIMVYYEFRNRVYITYYHDFESGHTIG